jgi:hypothetical protein
MKEQTEQVTIESAGTLDASAATLLYPPSMISAARPTAAAGYKSIFLYNTQTNKLNFCKGAAGYEACTSA